jgi:hypothetical protein
MGVLRKLSLALLVGLLAGCGFIRALTGAAKNIEKTTEEGKKTAKAARSLVETIAGTVAELAPYAVAAAVAALYGRARGRSGAPLVPRIRLGRRRDSA